VEPLIQRVPESFGYQGLTQKLTWMNDMSFHSEGDRYARSLSFHRFTSEAKEHLWQGRARSCLAEPDSARKVLEHFDAEGNRDLIDRMLFTDLMTRVPDHLLTMADRMSMAHSVEARPVFIDHGLVDFAGKLPANLKLRGRRSKYLLRKLSLRYLPPNLASRPKQGFAFPIGLWLRTKLAGFTGRLLAESRFVEAGIFRGSAVEELLADHLAGRHDHHYRLWMLINLELWHRIYMEGLDSDSMDSLIEEYLAEP
jgi:asparagine synthase (glutamine-hydrolysing)